MSSTLCNLCRTSIYSKLQLVKAPGLSQYKRNAASLSEDVLQQKYHLFIHPTVQEVLLRLTKVNPSATLPDYTTLKRPREVVLMTEEELKKSQKESYDTALYHIQMPPVLPERKPINTVLSEDPQITLFNKARSSYVFIDTTLGIPERERNIVVRSADGTLKLADWDVRDRVMEAYYPRQGRRVRPASMFYKEHINNLLERQQYRQLLDSACAQFEPDHPDYTRITHKVYKHCDNNSTYDKLLSTRHYGPMIFYYVISRQLNGILNHLIQHERVDECLDIINLYNLVWEKDSPMIKSSDSPQAKTDHVLAFLKSEGLESYDLQEEMKQYNAKQAAIKASSQVTDGDAEDASSSSSSESDSESSSDDDEPPRKP